MTAISSTLRESISVGCSASDAHRYLMEHFSAAGAAPTVLLRVPVADLALDREVIVSLSDLPSKPAQAVMEVSWSAKGGGPYPTFIGSLACLPDTSSRSRVELEGAYTIPGGLAGQAFDAAIGHHIAATATHSLLETLGRLIETARDHEKTLRSFSIAKPRPPVDE